MRTLELMIVFGALMAILAVVAIAIDWVGRPLRGRPFISRMYRYDDELAPGAPVGVGAAINSGQPGAARLPPIVLPPPAALAPPAPMLAPGTAPPANGSTSAFSDSVFAPPDTAARGIPKVTVAAETPDNPDAAWDELIAENPTAGVPQVKDNADVAVLQWQPGMALDATIRDHRPTSLDKAERYWKSKAASTHPTHFDRIQVQRMSEGRAPQRLNPLTSLTESLELADIRSASHVDDVRAQWPGYSVDPWSGS